MARPYAAEMAKLPSVFASTMSENVGGFTDALQTAASLPLLAVGSGGSLTAAHALAMLHHRHTGRLASVATPLDVLFEPRTTDASIWLISAGGNNVDALRAFRALALAEPSQLVVLCGRVNSPLAKETERFPFVHLLAYEPPSGKDGFLATNSLLYFVTLLTRAYMELGQGAAFTQGGNCVGSILNDSSHWDAWRAATSVLWARNTTLLLYGPATKVGAVDLESKFTEAALGNLQISDYRNFAHGRHHWLAKRASDSAVLAFVSEFDGGLAERTLSLIPDEIPKVSLTIFGSAEVAALVSLVAALRITGWAGDSRGIDPGRPGVPEFGRRLYHLSVRDDIVPVVGEIDEDDAVAIERKAGESIVALARRGDLNRWHVALSSFRQRLTTTVFGALALDYDGTLVGSRDRFVPPRAAVIEQIANLARDKTLIGIATGRGSSVRRDLQSTLPKECWPQILIGYYNGAEIGALADDSIPDSGSLVSDSLAVISAALRSRQGLSEIATQTDRRYQITLQPRGPAVGNRLWDIAHEVVVASGISNLKVTKSSHSVDILADGVSKVRVLERLNQRANSPVLTIGDRGRWPGNDYEFLSGPFSLSVDELNLDPTTCWNIAPKGETGVAATLHYLARLVADHGVFHFRAR